MALADHEIIRLCQKFGMISPFEPVMVRKLEGKERILAFGTDSAGYDLRLGESVQFFSADREYVIDPKNFDPDWLVTAPVKDGFVVLPAGTTALAKAVEHIKMPPNVYGLVIAKSTYARCGITLNATKMVPGWEGDLVLEISNMTPRPAKLYVGEGIASVIFDWVHNPDSLYGDSGGNYQGQTGVTLPKA